MSEEVKFTEEELNEIKSLQTDYLGIQNEFGQISLAQIRLRRQEDAIIEREEESLKKLSEIEEKENSLLAKITEKYGRGTLNPETGVFTAEKS